MGLIKIVSDKDSIIKTSVKQCLSKVLLYNEQPRQRKFMLPCRLQIGKFKSKILNSVYSYNVKLMSALEQLKISNICMLHVWLLMCNDFIKTVLTILCFKV